MHTSGEWYKSALPVVLSRQSEFDVVGVADCRTVDVTEEEAHANACLTAAGPTLLAACKVALTRLLGIGGIATPESDAADAAAVEMLRDAIAKTESGSMPVP